MRDEVPSPLVGTGSVRSEASRIRVVLGGFFFFFSFFLFSLFPGSGDLSRFPDGREMIVLKNNERKKR
jgi:hypothetical protein